MCYTSLLKLTKTSVVVFFPGYLLVEDRHTLLKLLLLVPDERALARKEEVDLLERSSACLGEEAVNQRHVGEHGTMYVNCQL